MDEVQKLSDSECYTPPLKPFTFEYIDVRVHLVS
jgi:hypothetical protein